MPTLTNLELQNAQEALAALTKERLPVKGALRLRKVVRAVEEHMRDVEEVRIGLLKQHAMLNDTGELVVEKNIVQFDDPEKQAAFEVLYRELMSETWEHPYGIEVEHLGTIDVSAETLLRLGNLLVEKEDA